MTLAGALAALARTAPDAPALRLVYGEVSFATLDDLARRYAAGFARLGINSGDRVSIWLPNTPHWLGAFFGLTRLGAIALCTNTRFRRAEMADLLARSGAKAILLQPGFRDADHAAILAECLPGLPALTHVVAVGGQDGVLEGRPVLAAGTLLEAPPLQEDRARPDDACLLFTTSGTTRRPKLVMHTQRAVLAHAADVARSYGYAEDAAGTLQLLPLCGTFGFSQAMAALLSGRPLALHPAFEAEPARVLVARHRITQAALTDEMVRRLCADPGGLPRGFRIITGSRAQELVPFALEHGLRVTGIYGSSEVQALFSHQPDGPDPMAMAAGGGRPVSAAAQVRARDPETGALCAAGQPGELEMKGPSVTIGYLGDEEATAKAFTEDGFFRTGDLGFVEADGSFRYLTRMGEAFRLNGFLVNPLEIEEVLQEHGSVGRCQAVAAEQEGRTRVVAFVLPRPGAAVEEAALRAHCAASMAGYKVPVRIVALDAFPTIESANNVKIHRASLRQMAQALLAKATPA